MKQLFTLMALALYCTSVNAQTDTNKIKENSTGIKMQADTSTTAGKASDTIRIGSMIIVTNGKKNNTNNGSSTKVVHEKKRSKKLSNVSTNWIILDLGFANYSDNTNYNNTGDYLYNRPGAAPLGKHDFDLNVGKSIDVNIWLFMQRLNLLKHHLHLKYGLGIELNNYRYSSMISYRKENPFVTGVAPAPVVFRDSIYFSKNKLATDYVTAPMMLSYCTDAYNQRKGFSISLGVSMGYLYNSRNKQISGERGKQKYFGGFDIKQFKFSWVGEIGMGPVRLYGSYSPTSFYERGLDMRPYTLGLRLSNW